MHFMHGRQSPTEEDLKIPNANLTKRCQEPIVSQCSGQKQRMIPGTATITRIAHP